MKKCSNWGAVPALMCAAAAAAATAASAPASSNLNLSKSNVYRLTYHAPILSEAQAKAMLAELDALGPMDEARLKQWLPANFRRFGVVPERVKKVVIVPAGKATQEPVILLLADPADEAQALAVTVKSSKSNSSD